MSKNLCIHCGSIINGSLRCPNSPDGSHYRRPPKLHTPPYMNDDEDGLFIFTDRHHGAGYTMEVAPQSTGNIEITIEEPGGEGHIFTLSHLDRADMLRALLHEFHYSPERGGPNDID